MIKDIEIHYSETEKYYLHIDGKLIGKHYNLRELCSQLLRESLEDYTESQAKSYILSKGYSWDKFNEWMRGQTVGVDKDGKSVFYSFDVERYRE